MDQKITLVLVDAEGNDVEHNLPVKFAVCDHCRGQGAHVNPSIDGNGISADEFAEDPDFAESYLAGHYDIQCETCKGLRVVPVVDEDRCDPELLAAYEEQQQEEGQYRAMVAAERRMESWAAGERW